MGRSLPLHLCHASKFLILLNRSHGLLHSTAIVFLVYYRASFLFGESRTPLSLWLLIFGSELLLSFIWLLGQPYRWHPVSRTVFTERLPEDAKLPAVDVFIVTADPRKEPTVEVMNTVLSAMALDYPVEKLHVYLSDDGGSAITLYGMREAWKFAKYWLPFCKKYGIKTRCPKAYFSTSNDDEDYLESPEFPEERQTIQKKYEHFKECIIRFSEDMGLWETNTGTSRDHPAVVEVVNKNCRELMEKDQLEMPLLVYVSREKRPSYPHNFKAGALNVLLRISGLMSNSPYILVLDCDMYCNDPTSARQAMCFHLDSDISSSLAFVQFPQRFHNISEHDIYDSQIRSAFEIVFPGLDGLRGPLLAGSGFYIKRESLYGNPVHKGNELVELKDTFGPSNEFIQTLGQNYKANVRSDGSFCGTMLQEAKILASCDYQSGTKWGQEVGFLYESVVEDVFTGFILHCRGWKSVYLNPTRPQFLGTCTTGLKDVAIQGTRWTAGLVEIGLSRFCPLLYGSSRLPLFQSLCYAEFSLFHLCYCISLWCFATVPQLALINGIALYPEVSSSFSLVFLFIFLSSISKHLYDVLRGGGTIQSWIYEQRMWMMKTVSSSSFGSLDAILKRLGIRETSFLPTNKTEDDENSKLYQMGIIDFQMPPMFLVPMVTVVVFNVISFTVGIVRSSIDGNWDKMFVQVFISFYILAINNAIIDGMVIRKDKGRIAPSVSLLSVAFSIMFLYLGTVFIPSLYSQFPLSPFPVNMEIYSSFQG